LNNIRSLIFFSLLVFSQVACCIPREDVLECGLPDGSKFILKSKYDWDPVAALIPADVQTEKDRTPYLIWYVNKKGIVHKTTAYVDYIGPYSDLNDQIDLSPFYVPCASLNKISFGQGIPLLDTPFTAIPLRYNGKKIEDMGRAMANKEGKAKQKSLAASAEFANSIQSSIYSGDLFRLEQQIKAGADINAPGNEGRAPLMLALDKPEFAPCALLLIKSGANLHPKGLKPDVTILMLAAGYSSPEVLKNLVDKQVFDVNQLNPNGETALTYAAAAGRLDNVIVLLEHGAMQVRNKQGVLIDIENARIQGYTDIVRLLELHK